MSDSLPENSFSGILRVVKLMTGEEIVGLVSEAMPDKITIKLPAKLESHMAKDQEGNLVEYVKLTNYAASIKAFEVNVARNAVIFIGQPNIELEKMYEIYFMSMQSDPKSVVSSSPDNGLDLGNGLHLLNDLFNNNDFVNFVNDLIESFEGVEILADFDGDDEEENEPEASIGHEVEEEPEPKPSPKKRRIVKPEGSKLPYKPDNPPEDPKSWSDNPQDYL